MECNSIIKINNISFVSHLRWQQGLFQYFMQKKITKFGNIYRNKHGRMGELNLNMTQKLFFLHLIDTLALVTTGISSLLEALKWKCVKKEESNVFVIHGVQD